MCTSSIRNTFNSRNSIRKHKFNLYLHAYRVSTIYKKNYRLIEWDYSYFYIWLPAQRYLFTIVARWRKKVWALCFYYVLRYCINNFRLARWHGTTHVDDAILYRRCENVKVKKYTTARVLNPRPHALGIGA